MHIIIIQEEVRNWMIMQILHKITGRLDTYNTTRRR